MQLNACHNRVLLGGSTQVQDGWTEQWHEAGHMTRVPVMVSIPVPMTKECQYSIRTPDPKCAGCKWNQQEKKSA